MGIFDVPTAILIEEVAKELKNKIKQPDFIDYVKTGSHKERTPNNPDWFYVRNASVLYQIYRNGASGTESLRSYYGGRKNRGVKPEKKRKASGKIIRVCLQSLEKEGLLKKEKKGRIVTGKGEKLLYSKAKELEKIVVEQEQKKAQEKQERLTKIMNNKKKAEQKADAERIHEKKEAEHGQRRTEAKKA